jgi:hypothetical protein
MGAIRSSCSSRCRSVIATEQAGELFEAVLHRRARQDEPPRRRQRLHVRRALCRPVLDALRLVEHHDVWCHPAHVLEVAEQLLVADDEEALVELVVLRCTLVGPPLHQLCRHARRRCPLAQPLRLQRGRHHEQSTPHLPARVQRVARCDGLRRLAEPHVVGQHEPPRVEEALHALSLVGVQLALHRFHMGQRARARAARLVALLGARQLLGDDCLCSGLCRSAALRQLAQQRKTRVLVREPPGVERVQPETRWKLQGFGAHAQLLPHVVPGRARVLVEYPSRRRPLGAQAQPGEPIKLAFER